MNLYLPKKTNCLLIFVLLIGVPIFVYFFIPTLQRLKSERQLVAQMQEKLAAQRQTIEGFLHHTEEEKMSWEDSKQKVKAMCQLAIDTLSLNDELIKRASYYGITDIIITPQSRGDRVIAPQSRGDRPVAPTGIGTQDSINILPSGISENKSSLKITFHADYESLGQFLQWFNDYPHQTSILSLNIQRRFPQIYVEMDVEVSQLTCDF